MSKKKHKVNLNLGKTQVVEEKYQLPISEIKKDLLKNLVYTVFAGLLIVVLKVLFLHQ